MYPAEDMCLAVSSRRNSGERDENWLKVLSREMQSLRLDGVCECSPMEKILRDILKDSEDTIGAK